MYALVGDVVNLLHWSLVPVGHLCDLPAGFAVSDNLVTLFYVMKKDVTELQLM